VYNPDGTFSLICRQEGDEVREMYLSTGKPAIAPQDHLLKKFPIGYHSTGVFLHDGALDINGALFSISCGG
jgi:hypothetical protein